MKRFKIVVDTGFVGGEHEGGIEFTDEEWDGMTEAEREDALQQACETEISNNISAYWEEVAADD